MLAADAELQVRPLRPSALDGDAHQFPHPFDVESDEGVMLDDALLAVNLDETAGVVARQAIGRLGQVVGAKAEELGGLGDIAGD